ncbi:MAG: SUF system NifU family Fe-S cluster assembly protein [Eubacteriales bacterium]|nr:SUF system NifU family Fe-S cluster assembly protein [Eubacteriales bacterium]
MDIKEIYTQMILEESRNKANKHVLEGATAVEKGHNPSCGDEITLQIKVANGIIEDAAFVGVGCAISQASTSMMIDLIRGKRVEEAKALAETFIGMIKKDITDEEELEVLEDAIAFQNISNLPARVKCAVLAWHTLSGILESD